MNLYEGHSHDVQKADGIEVNLYEGHSHDVQKTVELK